MLSWQTVKSSGQSTDTAISFFSAAYTIPCLLYTSYYGTEPNITRALDGVNFSVEAVSYTHLDKKPGRLFDTVAQAMSGIVYAAEKKEIAVSVDCLEDLAVSHDLSLIQIFYGMNNYITGAAIRALREKKRLTQHQLAEQLCVSDKAISKWETGVSHS